MIRLLELFKKSLAELRPVGVRRMGTRTLTVDRRLLGTWQYERRRTFKDYVFKQSVPSASVKKLKAIFGKLKVRWTRRRCETDLDGFKGVEQYDLVAQDADTVVVRCYDGFDPAG